MTETRKWSVGAVLAILALLAASWFLLIGPKRGEAASLRSERATQDQSNAQLVAQIDMLKQQAKDLPAQERKLEAVRRKLPEGPQLPALIRDLSAAAERSGVELVSLEPQTPAPLVAASAPGQPVPDPAAAAGVAPTAGGLYQIPITVKVSGGYYDVEQFFLKTESLRRAYLASGFSIEPADSAGAGAGGEETGAPVDAGGAGEDAAPGDVTATITARVFMTTDLTAAGAPTTATLPAPAPQTAGQPG